jgi:tetratricopeptide (TPR) repeat protein
MIRRLLLIAPLLVPLPLSGQLPGAWGDGDPEIARARAQSHFLDGRTRDALAEVRALLERDPLSYEDLWRAASFAVALGTERAEEGDPDEAVEWYDRALAWADSSVAVRPSGTEGRYWALAALGQTALSAGPREATGIADRIRTRALDLLDDEPEHAGAHNVLGRLYLEIMSRSGVTRFFGRAFFRGEALREASWELAEHHLRRAVASDPQAAMYQLDLGRLLLATGRRDEGRSALTRAAELAESHPPDQGFAREARRLLADSEG